ncbi:unnamed protein product [Plutella xylostella]|uniref:(diamondback moth) hypothetical protein n=1 Tax=Plutella xylostella TaxID=51655 RepID=A0A8S4F2I4_PLUXY|nr:unnamed protein product [Plutella xylostella]
MEGTTEKDCSPLWSLYQQIVSDMKPVSHLCVCLWSPTVSNYRYGVKLTECQVICCWYR